MEIRVQTQEGRRSVVELEGRLDLVSAAQVRAGLAEAVDAGHPLVVVDLTGVPTIDSSGLGALVAGLKHARQAGGELRIAAAGEQVRTVLDLTKLTRVLRPYDTVAEALEGL